MGRGGAKRQDYSAASESCTGTISCQAERSANSA
jgi:hypothetical protein